MFLSMWEIKEEGLFQIRKTKNNFAVHHLQLGTWGNVQMLTRAICLYFEYYELKWITC